MAGIVCHRTTDGQVSVIRKELVDLTQDTQVAVVLNQLLYWCQRVKDFEQFLEEERNTQLEANPSLTYGWIYKTAHELIEETLLTVSRPTMRKYLRILVDEGWIEEKQNPEKKWDRTTFVRLNLKKIHDDLLELGYRLPGFEKDLFHRDEQLRNLTSNEKNLTSKLENLTSKERNLTSREENLPALETSSAHKLENLTSREENSLSNAENLTEQEKNLTSKLRNLTDQERIFPSKLKNLTAYTYTETTAKNTNREHTHRLRARENFSNLEKLLVGEPELAASTWSKCNSSEPGWDAACEMEGPAPSDCGSGESDLARCGKDESQSSAYWSNESDSNESHLYTPGSDKSGGDGSDLDDSVMDTSVTDKSDSGNWDAKKSADKTDSGKPAEKSDADKFGTDKSRTDESGTDKSLGEEMICLWEQYVLQKLFPSRWKGVLERTETRKDQLASLLAFHFKNDMRLWETFCLRVTSTSFLMGGGPNGWTINLDWILDDGNLRKVLEGNYGGVKRTEAQERGARGAEWCGDAIQPPPCRDAEKAAIIASIKDPVWKKWCTRLAEGVRLNEQQMLHEPLSVSDLKDMANAWFLECENERLVWVGSNDQRVLNKIDDIRLRITWAFEKEYPKARSFRTRLQPHNIGETHA